MWDLGKPKNTYLRPAPAAAAVRSALLSGHDSRFAPLFHTNLSRPSSSVRVALAPRGGRAVTRRLAVAVAYVVARFQRRVLGAGSALRGRRDIWTLRHRAPPPPAVRLALAILPDGFFGARAFVAQLFDVDSRVHAALLAFASRAVALRFVAPTAPPMRHALGALCIGGALVALRLTAPRAPAVRYALAALPCARVTSRLRAPLATAVRRALPAAHVGFAAPVITAPPLRDAQAHAPGRWGGQGDWGGGGGGGGVAKSTERHVTLLTRRTPGSAVPASELPQQTQRGPQALVQIVFVKCREPLARKRRLQGSHRGDVHALFARALAELGENRGDTLWGEKFGENGWSVRV